MNSTNSLLQSTTNRTTASPSLSKQRTRCEVWTRVMGYHRPVSHFNIGKRSEHASRKHFLECVASNAQFVAQYAAAQLATSTTATC